MRGPVRAPCATPARQAPCTPLPKHTRCDPSGHCRTSMRPSAGPPCAARASCLASAFSTEPCSSASCLATLAPAHAVPYGESCAQVASGGAGMRARRARVYVWDRKRCGKVLRSARRSASRARRPEHDTRPPPVSGRRGHLARQLPVAAGAVCRRGQAQACISAAAVQRRGPLGARRCGCDCTRWARAQGAVWRPCPEAVLSGTQEGRCMLPGAAGRAAAAQRWDPGPGDEGVLAAHCATRLAATQGQAPRRRPLFDKNAIRPAADAPGLRARGRQAEVQCTPCAHGRARALGAPHATSLLGGKLKYNAAAPHLVEQHAAVDLLHRQLGHLRIQELDKAVARALVADVVLDDLDLRDGPDAAEDALQHLLRNSCAPARRAPVSGGGAPHSTRCSARCPGVPSRRVQNKTPSWRRQASRRAPA